jgi:hypothetical protein
VALPATEAFTGANDTALNVHSASWAHNSGLLEIQSNGCAPDATGVECGARWTADAFANDQYSQCVLAAKSGSTAEAVGPGVRHAAAGTGTYYGYYQDGGSTGYCFKMVAGTWTQLGATFGSAAAGVTLKLEVQGTTLTVYHNGVSQGTRTDSAIASGVGGITGFGSSTGMRADIWEAGNLSTAVTGTLAKTLGTLTAAGTGTVAVGGTLAKTLGALTAAGTGTVQVAGAASITLGALTAAGVGSVTVSGVAAITLGALTLAAAGDNGEVAPPAAGDDWRMRTRRRRRA